MALGKLKTAASTLTLAFLVGAGGLLAFHSLAAQPAQVKQDDPAATREVGKSNDDRGKQDNDRASPGRGGALRPEQQQQRIEKLEQRLQKVEDNVKRLEERLKALEGNGKSKW